MQGREEEEKMVEEKKGEGWRRDGRGKGGKWRVKGRGGEGSGKKGRVKGWGGGKERKKMMEE